MLLRKSRLYWKAIVPRKFNRNFSFVKGSIDEFNIANVKPLVITEMQKRTPEIAFTAVDLHELTDFYVSHIPSLTQLHIMRAMEKVFRSQTREDFMTSMAKLKRSCHVSSFVLSTFSSDKFFDDPNSIFPLDIPQIAPIEHVINLKVDLVLALFECKKYNDNNDLLDIIVSNSANIDNTTLQDGLEQCIDFADFFVKSVPANVSEKVIDVFKLYFNENGETTMGVMLRRLFDAVQYHSELLPRFGDFVDVHVAHRSTAIETHKNYISKRKVMTESAFLKLQATVDRINEGVTVEEPVSKEKHRYFGSAHCLKSIINCNATTTDTERLFYNGAVEIDPEFNYVDYGMTPTFMEHLSSQNKIFLSNLHPHLIVDHIRDAMEALGEVEEVWLFREPGLEPEFMESLESEYQHCRREVSSSEVELLEPEVQDSINGEDGSKKKKKIGKWVVDDMEAVANDDDNDDDLEDDDEDEEDDDGDYGEDRNSSSFSSGSIEKGNEYFSLCDDDLVSSEVAALKKKSSKGKDKDKNRVETSHPFAQFISMARHKSARPVLKDVKNVHCAFVKFKNSIPFEKMCSYDVQMFGISIMTTHCHVFSSHTQKTLIVELGEIYSVQQVLGMTREVLGDGYSVTYDRDVNDLTKKPIFVHMEFRDHSSAWIAFEKLCRAHRNGYPFKPRWSRHELYFLIAEKEKNVRIKKIME